MTTPLAYVIDTLVFDVYVNRESPSAQSVPTKVRPWLMICMEPKSRRVLASYLSDQHPDLESVKEILQKGENEDHLRNEHERM